MAELKPFPALLPQPQFVQEVCCLPHRPVARERAAQFLKDHPYSFLGIVHAELEFKEGNATVEQIIERAHTHLDELVEAHAIVRDSTPGFYIYQIVSSTHTQTGIVGCLALDDFVNGVVRRHENTLPKEVSYRAALLRDLKTHHGPSYLLYRNFKAIDQIVDEEIKTPALREYRAIDNTVHRIWHAQKVQEILDAASQISTAYIADGHHRIDAALQIRDELVKHGTDLATSQFFNYFPVVLFPDNQLRILPFHRFIRSAQLSDEEILAKLSDHYTFVRDSSPQQPEKGSISIYLNNTWYNFRLKHAITASSDPTINLEVALFQRFVLEPIFAISDQRTDPNIGFLPGTYTPTMLEELVIKKDVRFVFMLHATTIEELIAVSDAGQVMAPKSTWFEPKLCSGLLVHRLDD